MMELTEVQMRVVERLFEAGFRPIAIAPYESALIVHKGECAAVLGPVENGGLKLLVPVTFLVDGNLSVKLKKSSGDVFVWKKKEVAATEERLKELEEFRAELVGILEGGETQ
jgi:isopentenyl phosphate kinase